MMTSSTSASSAAIQGGQAGYNALLNMSLKDANQLADRILGWHGLCLGILDALEQLRQTLVQEILSITEETNRKDDDKENENASVGEKATTKKRREKDALILQQVLNSRSRSSGNWEEQSLEVLNAVALGSYHTTRHGLTGVVSFLHALRALSFVADCALRYCV